MWPFKKKQKKEKVQEVRLLSREEQIEFILKVLRDSDYTYEEIINARYVLEEMSDFELNLAFTLSLLQKME